MRTTITLEAETEALVRRTAKDRKLSFKEVVNEAIVRGLRPEPAREIELPVFDMGAPRINLDKATQLAGELEDEEILRKLAVGK